MSFGDRRRPRSSDWSRLRSNSNTPVKKSMPTLKREDECNVIRTAVLDAIAELENEDLEKNARALGKCLDKAGQLEKRAFEQMPPEFKRLLAKDVFDTEVRKKIEESEAYKNYDARRKAEFEKLAETRRQKLAELQELQTKLANEQKEMDRVKRELFFPVNDDLLFVRNSGEEVEDENLPPIDHNKIPQSFAFDSELTRPNSTDQKRTDRAFSPNCGRG
jgi:hypothetical protein